MKYKIEGRAYADCKLLGDHGDVFFDLDLLTQALHLAYSEGCPVGPDLVKPISAGGRGAEAMIPRYGQVIFWFRYLLETIASQGREDLVESLYNFRPRKMDQELGEHSPEWLPIESKSIVFRSTAGYILPRLFCEFVYAPNSEPSERLQVALSLLESTLADLNGTADELEFVIAYAEGLADYLKSIGRQDQIKQIVSRLRTTAKVKEDNLNDEHDRILDLLSRSVALNTL